MENSPIKVPKSAVSMVSPRDYRLSSLCGYCVTFIADVPINVPPMVYREALQMGARVVDVEDIDKEPEVKEPTLSEESLKEAAKLEAEAKAGALTAALTVIITRNTPEDFKADGTPKANKVITEMSPEISRPTATEISDAYQALQENIDLAED